MKQALKVPRIRGFYRLGLRVKDLGFKVWGLGFGVRVSGLGSALGLGLASSVTPHDNDKTGTLSLSNQVLLWRPRSRSGFGDGMGLT